MISFKSIIKKLKTKKLIGYSFLSHGSDEYIQIRDSETNKLVTHKKAHSELNDISAKLLQVFPDFEYGSVSIDTDEIEIKLFYKKL